METDYYVDVEIDNSINVESTESGQHIDRDEIRDFTQIVKSP